MPAAALLALLLGAAVLALALSASPAAAFSQWQHDGATGCVCHDSGTPTDASCVGCHSGFKSFPGESCWTCHYPGQDTSTLSTPGSACSQECHLWNGAQKAYVIPSTHGANPHRGSTTDCTACHGTSVSISNPGSSPHHSGQETGFTDCAACHSGFQQHAGKVQCTRCHTTAAAFHLYTANSPGFKNCRGCHAMRHAGKTVPNSKCATCHKGSSGRQAQHSKSVTKKYVCGTCHSKKLHARAFSSAITSCRSCHQGKYHAQQRTPSRSVCTRCHSAALHHANGFQCTLCHRRAIHNTRPSAVN
jgi:hypothetical protein